MENDLFITQKNKTWKVFASVSEKIKTKDKQKINKQNKNIYDYEMT